MLKPNSLRYVVAFLLSSTLFLLLFLIMNLEPFQSRYFLTSDLLHQYYVFHTWLGETLRSGDFSALFYEWSAGLGNNMIGTYMYYLSSPFSLLSIFFNEKTMPLGITLILTLKIGSLATSFYWLLTRLTKRHQWTSYFFALCYAFSGFTLTYLMNLMWLDQLILLPILFYTTLLFVHENRRFPLLITLLISFFVNFYTAYMSDFFIALIVIVEFFKKHSFSDWKLCLKYLFHLLGLAFVAFSLLGCFLIPTLTQLFAGGSSILSFNFDILYSPLSLLETLTVGFYDGVRTEHLPPLYFGTLPLILTFSFFFQPEIPSKERKLHAAVWAFLLISFSLNPFYNLWHGFKSPIWFAGRHSFVFIFYSLYLAFRCFQLQLKQKTVRPLRYGFFLTLIPFSILTLLQEIQYWESLQHPKATISSLLLSWIFLLLYALLFWLILKPTNRLSWRCLFYFAFMELCLNAGLTLTTFSRDLTFFKTADLEHLITTNETLLTHIETLEAESDSEPQTFSRYNLNQPLINNSLLFRYSGLHSFNTLNNLSHIKVLNHLTNYTQFSNSTFFFSHSYPILNSLFGVNYLFHPTTLTEFYTTTETEGLYYNPYALGLGFKADLDLLNLDLSEQSGAESQSLLLNALLGQLDQPTDFYIPSKLNIIGAENLEWNDERLIYDHVDASESSVIEYQIYPQSDTPVYLTFALPLQNSSDLTLTINGEPYQNLSTSNFIILPSQVSELIFECAENVPCGIPNPKAFQIDETALQTAFQSLKETEFVLTEKTSTFIQGTVSFEEEGILFTSIPFDKGWKATVNGQPVNTLSLVHQGFLGLQLPAGDHIIELSYTPPGFKEGLLLSLMTLNSLIFYCLIKKTPSGVFFFLSKLIDNLQIFIRSLNRF